MTQSNIEASKANGSNLLETVQSTNMPGDVPAFSQPPEVRPLTKPVLEIVQRVQPIATWLTQQYAHPSTKPRRRERDGSTIYESRTNLAGHQVVMYAQLPGKTTAAHDRNEGVIDLEVGFATEPTDYFQLGGALNRRQHAVISARPDTIGNPLHALERRREIAAGLGEYACFVMGFEAVSYVGYSQGNDTATHGAEVLAKTDPALVRVLIDLLGHGNQAEQGLGDLLGRRIPKFVATEGVEATINHPLMMAKIASNLGRHGIDLLATGVGLGRTNDPAYDVVERLNTSIPVYHVVANNDAFFDPKHPKRRTKAESQVSLGPRTNHLSVIKNPERTAAVIHDLIQKAAQYRTAA